MTVIQQLPDAPVQRLPREAYISDSWLERERHELFSRTWTFVGVTTDFKEAGDYRTIRTGAYPLVVLRDQNGELNAYHNLCRHRGTELLEGAGNTGRKVVCPYHFWAYNLDGALRSVPNQAACFPGLDKSKTGLRKASLGVFKDLVFAHPSATPEASFDDWLAGLGDIAWPHDVTSSDLEEFDGDVVYEMKCNWKVFFENAIDGYHLAHLHNKTLGGPAPDKNTWEVHGQHLVWYSTEGGVKGRMPRHLATELQKHGVRKIRHAEAGGYGGVYMLFPTTVITADAYAFSISRLDPVDANTTLLRSRTWSPRGFGSLRETLTEIPGYDPATGRVTSDKWTKRPLETGDFQTEDVWVCEKMQRSLRSPAYQVGGLARGAGGEAALDFFQANILHYLRSD